MKKCSWVGPPGSAMRAFSNSFPDFGFKRFPIFSWWNLYMPSVYGPGGFTTSGLKSVHDHSVLFGCFSSAPATIHELSWLAVIQYLSL
ncbi:hypothetical protein PRUPE_5G237100 [Prunus persica]|uniref:Uncharacterized protein n=1 Tax=Prunus persica TaxID=3760 RepID=A0A251PCX4_PRUPE|nr:hypothetical protein PRUPE_5G237100 [Prunus persica]